MRMSARRARGTKIPIGNPPMATVEFLRGYVAADAFVRGSTYRFVNTHLEIQGGSLDPLLPFVQAAQAQELISMLATETRPVILVGDFNSSPQATPTSGRCVPDLPNPASVAVRTRP